MLATRNDIKTLLGLTGVSEDARIDIWLSAADRAIKTYCNQNFEFATYTEYYTGNNQYRLALRQVPVVNITSLWVDNAGYYGDPASAFGSSTLLTPGVDYTLDRQKDAEPSLTGIVFRLGTVWPIQQRVGMYSRLTADIHPAFGNIKVIYDAGYATIPADLAYACMLLVSQMRRTYATGGFNLESERIGDYSYKLALNMLHQNDLASVNTILAMYKQLGW